jgi:energy-coupling factor transporter transmembrane protein EcfT
MSRHSIFRSPLHDLSRAAVMPLKALLVVGLCATINAWTYSGTWWVKWVALGMGIAVLVAWARAAKTLLLLALVAWVGWKIYQRHGQQARDRFDSWVAQQKPQAAEVLQSLRTLRPGNAA